MEVYDMLFIAYTWLGVWYPPNESQKEDKHAWSSKIKFKPPSLFFRGAVLFCSLMVIAALVARVIIVSLNSLSFDYLVDPFVYLIISLDSVFKNINVLLQRKNIIKMMNKMKLLLDFPGDKEAQKVNQQSDKLIRLFYNFN